MRRPVASVREEPEDFKQLVSQQMEAKGMTIAALAAKAGVPATTVAKAIQSPDDMSPATAVQLSEAIGLDPVHAALSATLAQMLRKQRAEPNPLLRRSIEVLDDFTNFQRNNRYLAKGSGLRLAFRAFRRGYRAGAPHAARLSRDQVAAELVAIRAVGNSQRSALAKELRLFEEDRIPGDHLDEYLVALQRAAGDPAGITRAHLEDFAARSRRIHRLDETAEVQILTDRGRQRVESDPAWRIQLARTATGWGALLAETLTQVRADTAAKEPPPPAAPPGRSRILNARHDGVELAVVTRGTVVLYQTAQSIKSWSDLSTGVVVDAEEIHAGRAVVFPSRRYWHHAELIADGDAGASVTSFNIIANLLLHRRLSSHED